MTTIGNWESTSGTCGHCLAEYYGDFGNHTCAGADDRKLKPLPGGFTSETARQHFIGKRATENLANALASSPTFRVELEPAFVANLAAADAMAHGEHLTTTGQARKSIISQAARDYGLMRARQGRVAVWKRGTNRTRSTGQLDHAADARHYLGLHISVEYALSKVPEAEREDARRLAAEEAELAQRWLDQQVKG